MFPSLNKLFELPNNQTRKLSKVHVWDIYSHLKQGNLGSSDVIRKLKYEQGMRRDIRQIKQQQYSSPSISHWAWPDLTKPGEPFLGRQRAVVWMFVSLQNSCRNLTCRAIVLSGGGPLGAGYAMTVLSSWVGLVPSQKSWEKRVLLCHSMSRTLSLTSCLWNARKKFLLLQAVCLEAFCYGNGKKNKKQSFGWVAVATVHVFPYSMNNHNLSGVSTDFL